MANGIGDMPEKTKILNMVKDGNECSIPGLAPLSSLVIEIDDQQSIYYLNDIK